MKVRYYDNHKIQVEYIVDIPWKINSVHVGGGSVNLVSDLHSKPSFEFGKKCIEVKKLEDCLLIKPYTPGATAAFIFIIAMIRWLYIISSKSYCYVNFLFSST